MRLVDHRLSVSVFNTPYDFQADAMKNEHKLRTCGGMHQQDHTSLVSWRAGLTSVSVLIIRSSQANMFLGRFN
jgi:hypothetical protein